MTTNSSIKQRGGQTPKRATIPVAAPQVRELDTLRENLNSAVTPQWDYRLSFAIITALAFVTRFWGIGHPNEVVFDEVHFGKV